MSSGDLAVVQSSTHLDNWRDMNPQDRFKDYQGDKCWQGYMRLLNLLDDLKTVGLTLEESKQLRTSDFVFGYVSKEDKEGCREIKEFIERHEWLGKLSQRSTHRFTARLKSNNALAGVVIMATPNALTPIIQRRVGLVGESLERNLNTTATLKPSA